MPSSAPTTSSPWGATGCPDRPTPGSRSAPSPGRPSASGWARSSPRPPSACPGLLAIEVAQVDAMCGGRVELGPRRRLVRRRAHGLRLRRSRRWVSASSGSRRSSPSSPGCGARRSARRSASTGTTTTSRTAPRCPSRPSDPTRRSSSGAVGPKRTPRLAATYADEFNLPFSSLADTEAQYARVRAACADRGRDPDDAAPLGRPGRLLRRRRGRGRAPRRQHRAQGRRAAGQRRRRHAGRGRGPPARPSPASGPRPSTSRCSTCTTSSTSSCWPRKCCPGSPDQPAHEVLGGVAVHPSHGPMPLK